MHAEPTVSHSTVFASNLHESRYSLCVSLLSDDTENSFVTENNYLHIFIKLEYCSISEKRKVPSSDTENDELKKVLDYILLITYSFSFLMKLSSYP